MQIRIFESILKTLKIHSCTKSNEHAGSSSYHVISVGNKSLKMSEIFISLFTFSQNLYCVFGEGIQNLFRNNNFRDEIFPKIAFLSPELAVYVLPYCEWVNCLHLLATGKLADRFNSLALTYSTDLEFWANVSTLNQTQHADKDYQLTQTKLLLQNLLNSNCCLQVMNIFRLVTDTLDRSPSPKMQWFIFLSEAYRANLYYSGLKKYNQASEITRDILTRTDTLLHWASPFGSGLFLLQICLEWPSIFDANIQVSIGFLNLRQLVLRRKVVKLKWIKVCPVLFLHYIRIQSLNRLNRLNFGEICQMLAHLEVCLVDRQINKLSLGPLVIVAALHSSKIDLLGFHRIHESLNQVTITKLRTTPASISSGFFKLFCYCGVRLI